MIVRSPKITWESVQTWHVVFKWAVKINKSWVFMSYIDRRYVWDEKAYNWKWEYRRVVG